MDLCTRLGRLLKTRWMEFLHDLVLVVIGLLAFVGLSAFVEESMSLMEYVQAFGPLLLGIVGVVAAFVTLHMNLSASREQFQHNKDLEVRPVLVMSRVTETKFPFEPARGLHFHAPDGLSKYRPQRSRIFVIENIGKGPALHIEFVVEGKGQYSPASDEVDTLRVNDHCYLLITTTLDDGWAERIHTYYKDVYSNNHRCVHELVIRDDQEWEIVENKYSDDFLREQS